MAASLKSKKRGNKIKIATLSISIRLQVKPFFSGTLETGTAGMRGFQLCPGVWVS